MGNGGSDPYGSFAAVEGVGRPRRFSATNEEERNVRACFLKTNDAESTDEKKRKNKQQKQKRNAILILLPFLLLS